MAINNDKINRRLNDVLIAPRIASHSAPKIINIGKATKKYGRPKPLTNEVAMSFILFITQHA